MNRRAQWVHAASRDRRSAERYQRLVRAASLHVDGTRPERIAIELGVGSQTVNMYLKEAAPLIDKLHTLKRLQSEATRLDNSPSNRKTRAESASELKAVIHNTGKTLLNLAQQVAICEELGLDSPELIPAVNSFRELPYAAVIQSLSYTLNDKKNEAKIADKHGIIKPWLQHWCSQQVTNERDYSRFKSEAAKLYGVDNEKLTSVIDRLETHLTFDKLTEYVESTVEAISSITGQSYPHGRVSSFGYSVYRTKAVTKAFVRKHPYLCSAAVLLIIALWVLFAMQSPTPPASGNYVPVPQEQPIVPAKIVPPITSTATQLSNSSNISNVNSTSANNVEPALVESGTTVFSEGFESELQGWIQQWTPDATITTEQFYSGKKALKSTGRLSGIIHDMGKAQDNAEYHCYFYDGLQSIEGARCAVSLSQSINTQITTSVGVNTQISSDYYVVHAPDGQSWITTRIPRTKGWHHTIISTHNRKHQVFIDSNLVATMNDFPPWTHIFAFMEDLQGTPAPAYFDNLAVIEK